MEKNDTNELKDLLILARQVILNRAREAFQVEAYEGHVFGSVARNDTDPYSDLDIWFTFEDSNYQRIFQNRFSYYEKLGRIIHVCEAPQNAPIGGVHSALIVETQPGVLTMVDIYLCPLSNSFVTNDSQKLFGEDLPIKEIGFNPQKVQVGNDYRIDFFTCFAFNTIKKIARQKEHPLQDVFGQYTNLREKYNFPLPEIRDVPQGLLGLEKIIEGVLPSANERQVKTLEEIIKFGKLVLK